MNDCKIFENLVSSSHKEEHTDTNKSTKLDVDSEGSAENIYFKNDVFELKATDKFLGACIDSAAQKTVIAKRKMQSYFDSANVP